MTNTEVSRKTGKPETVADMIAQISADESLPPRKRQDVCSALRTIAKAKKTDPTRVPAHAGQIRESLKDFSPALLKMSPERWANVLSLVRFAFAHLRINGARSTALMSPGWAAALAPMPTKAMRVGLLSCGRFHTGIGLEPEDVTQATFDAFKSYLINTRISRDPRETHRMACKLWNDAADKVASWPKVKVNVPNYRNSYIVPWSTFPQTLKDETDRYLDHLAGKDRFAKRGFKPLRPASISTKRVHLHEYSSALARAGYDVAKLTSLNDLLTQEALETALAYFLDERKAPRQAHSVAVTLLIMAKHWVKVSDERLEDLRSVCKELDVTPSGMTAKNKARMRQFDDPDALQALIELPRKLLKQAAKTSAPCKQALLVQTAVAVEILLMAPIRLQNLSHLEVGRHVIRMRKNVVRIVIPEQEVKNGQEYDIILLPEPSALLELYIDKHLAVLQRGKPSAWLFPGYKGPKCHPALRQQIMAAIKRECGVVLNPHAFRHLAAKIILDAEPGAYGKTQLVLNHTTIGTSQRVYAGSENAAAMRHYDEHILERRGPWQPGKTQSGPKGKRHAA